MCIISKKRNFMSQEVLTNSSVQLSIFFFSELGGQSRPRSTHTEYESISDSFVACLSPKSFECCHRQVLLDKFSILHKLAVISSELYFADLWEYGTPTFCFYLTAYSELKPYTVLSCTVHLVKII